MDTFMIVVSLASGAYLIFTAFIMDTSNDDETGNVQSTVLFKLVPLLLGLGSLVVGLKLLGWI